MRELVSDARELIFGSFQLDRCLVELLDPGSRLAQGELCIASRILSNPLDVVRDGEEQLARSLSMLSVAIELHFEPSHFGEQLLLFGHRSRLLVPWLHMLVRRLLALLPRLVTRGRSVLREWIFTRLAHNRDIARIFDAAHHPEPPFQQPTVDQWVFADNA